jgi:hypothetical protein
MTARFFFQMLALAIVVVAVVMYWRAGPDARKEARGSVADLAGGCCLVLVASVLLLVNLTLAVYRLLS